MTFLATSSEAAAFLRSAEPRLTVMSRIEFDAVRRHVAATELASAAANAAPVTTVGRGVDAMPAPRSFWWATRSGRGLRARHLILLDSHAMQASKLQPAVLGGVFDRRAFGFADRQCRQLCCCLWVLLGGAVAAVSAAAEPVDAADCRGTVRSSGLLAGIVGAVVGTVLTIPVPVDVRAAAGGIHGSILDNPEFRRGEAGDRQLHAIGRRSP